MLLFAMHHIRLCAQNRVYIGFSSEGAIRVDSVLKEWETIGSTPLTPPVRKASNLLRKISHVPRYARGG